MPIQLGSTVTAQGRRHTVLDFSFPMPPGGRGVDRTSCPPTQVQSGLAWRQPELRSGYLFNVAGRSSEVSRPAYLELDHVLTSSCVPRSQSQHLRRSTLDTNPLHHGSASIRHRPRTSDPQHHRSVLDHKTTVALGSVSEHPMRSHHLSDPSRQASFSPTAARTASGVEWTHDSPTYSSIRNRHRRLSLVTFSATSRSSCLSK